MDSRCSRESQWPNTYNSATQKVDILVLALCLDLECHHACIQSMLLHVTATRWKPMIGYPEGPDKAA